jgi:hypothetical protein
MSNQALIQSIQSLSSDALDSKDALSAILAYTQYHSRFNNIFTIYQKRFNEHNINYKHHQKSENILKLV